MWLNFGRPFRGRHMAGGEKRPPFSFENSSLYEFLLSLRSLFVLSAVLSTPRVCFSSDSLSFFRVVPSPSCISTQFCVSQNLVPPKSPSSRAILGLGLPHSVNTIAIFLPLHLRQRRVVHSAHQWRGSSPFHTYPSSLPALPQAYLEPPKLITRTPYRLRTIACETHEWYLCFWLIGGSVRT